MPGKKQIRRGDKIGLKLTSAERTLLLEGLTCLPTQYEHAINGTPTFEPVMLTLDDLDDLGGYVAADANHATNKKLQKKLDAVFQKIQHLLETHTDDEPPQTVKIDDAKKAKAMSDQSVQIAAWVAKMLIAAEQLGIKNKPLEHFCLAPAQRDVLLLVPGISKSIKNKLAKKSSSYTVAELAGMTMVLAEGLPNGEAQRLAVLLVAQHLMDRLQEGIAGPVKPKRENTKKPKADPTTLFQFKITLLESKPSIWRRIQVKDCTMDKLHEHIQTAMGWTNSHLNQFKIGEQLYGDPLLMEENFEEFGYQDSTMTMLSDIIPKNSKRFRFLYEYDFGDGWEHEVLFEGCPKIEAGRQYPMCLEGERACPPEDCGGVWGYADFLEAISNKKHEEHESMLEWVGGNFDPEKFDPVKATKAMKKGLPDWRSIAGW